MRSGTSPGAGHDILPRRIRLSVAIGCAQLREKSLSVSVNGGQEQLQPNTPETVSPAKHLFYERR